jgi:collagen type III alpha
MVTMRTRFALVVALLAGIGGCADIWGFKDFSGSDAGDDGTVPDGSTAVPDGSAAAPDSEPDVAARSDAGEEASARADAGDASAEDGGQPDGGGEADDSGVNPSDGGDAGDSGTISGDGGDGGDAGPRDAGGTGGRDAGDSGTATCAQICTSGCCNAQGQCVAGTAVAACGSGGRTCVTCGGCSGLSPTPCCTSQACSCGTLVCL